MIGKYNVNNGMQESAVLKLRMLHGKTRQNILLVDLSISSFGTNKKALWAKSQDHQSGIQCLVLSIGRIKINLLLAVHQEQFTCGVEILVCQQKNTPTELIVSQLIQVEVFTQATLQAAL